MISIAGNNIICKVIINSRCNEVEQAYPYHGRTGGWSIFLATINVGPTFSLVNNREHCSGVNTENMEGEL